MTSPLRLGIAGLGTVGAGVVKILQNSPDLLSLRAGRPLELVAVSAQSRNKDRGVDLSGYAWEDDPVALATRADVDVFVELIGGDAGPAKASVQAALEAGKHVVTANKALLAHHAQPLAELAEAQGVNLRFEAAVAGGIPIIKALTEGLAGNNITRVMGVMNGTCNYILTQMQATGRGYNALFEECAQLGYLEADPNLDVGGIDAAHKLVLLSAIAFGTQVDFESADLQGIQAITLEDIEHAADMGYRIKLLGVAQHSDAGLNQTMKPCLVPSTTPLAQLEGGTNMVIVEGDAVEQVALRGPGAGEGPTASAVMGDIMDIARGINLPVFGIPAKHLKPAKRADAQGTSAYYIRLNLRDKPGVMAKTSAALAESNVSIDRMRQKSHDQDTAPTVIITHPASPAALADAVSKIEAAGICRDAPLYLQLVDL